MYRCWRLASHHPLLSVPFLKEKNTVASRLQQGEFASAGCGIPWRARRRQCRSRCCRRRSRAPTAPAPSPTVSPPTTRARPPLSRSNGLTSFSTLSRPSSTPPGLGLIRSPFPFRFRRLFPLTPCYDGFCRQRAENDPTVPDAPAKAEKFAQRCASAAFIIRLLLLLVY
jgi:hypothetical protein